MGKLRLLAGMAAFSICCAAPAAAATITTYGSQSAFQAALDGSFTLINLDAAPFNAFASGYRLDDAGPAAALLAAGIDSVGFNAQVLAGQNGQTPTNRDRLIANGAGFGGLIAFNFVSPVNGIGAFSNNIDFGRVRAFSGANLGGDFLGQVQFGPGGFGGLTSMQSIGSVQFTCDHNSDLRCGVYDIQFGTFAPNNAIPEPASWALMIVGFGLLGWHVRRHRSGGVRLASRAA
jgi:hypothetical protein